MVLVISSVKLSAKIPARNLDEIRDKCLEQNITYSIYNNFIAFRLPKYTFIIFKRRLLKNCEEDSNVLQHANITVKNIIEIDQAIDSLRKLLQYEENSSIPFTIDNLTVTASLGKSINVEEFLKITRHITDKVSFNPEQFPAIFFKYKTRKILLFRSGILNILGCKNTDELDETYSWIKSICVSI